jgi:H+/gluconate symporter-like permease
MFWKSCWERAVLYGWVSWFLINNFAIFMFGSILDKYMEASGATQTIANSILKVLGKDSPYKGLLAITLIASILTYGA